MTILTDVRGETIKKIGLLMVLAIAALLSAPALADRVPAMGGDGAVDVLGDGIFETEGSSFRFPVEADTSVDTLTVGDDEALAFGMVWGMDPPAVATNNLEIKKNQDSGGCDCCNPLAGWGKAPAEETMSPSGLKDIIGCQDCCKKMNIEQINVGNREAMAFGFATATNNVKIVTNQQ